MSILNELVKREAYYADPATTFVQTDLDKQGGMPTPGGDIASGVGEVLYEVLGGDEAVLKDEFGNTAQIQEAGFSKPIAKILKSILKPAVKAGKKAKKKTIKDMKKRIDYAESLNKGTRANTAYRKTLNQFLRPGWAGPSGTFFGSGTYSDYGVDLLKNVKNLDLFGTAGSLGRLGKYGLGKFGTAPNLAAMWEGLAGEPFSERTGGGGYIPNFANLMLESYTDYYQPIGEAAQSAGMSVLGELAPALNPLLELGASQKYLDEKEKERKKALNKKYDVKKDSTSGDDSIDTILKLSGFDKIPDKIKSKIKKKLEDKKTVKAKKDTTNQITIDFKGFHLK